MDDYEHVEHHTLVLEYLAPVSNLGAIRVAVIMGTWAPLDTTSDTLAEL